MVEPIAALSVVADAVLSSHPAVADDKEPSRSAVDALAFVISDEIRRLSGTTRVEWNVKMPKSEARWREASAATGTKDDNRLFRRLRKEGAPPPDHKPSDKKGG